MEKMTKKVGKLKVYVYETRAEMGKAAALDAEKRINKFISENGEVTIVFAAAPSQNELLAALKEANVDWTKVRALHMDEYIGLPEDHPAGFGNFLRRAIFDLLPFKAIHYLYDQHFEADEICDRYAELLEEFPPDLILLGVGENGHLAFNDPAVADFNDPLTVKIVELDEVCRTQQVNDGCFSDLSEVPEKAITITMSAIMNAKETICVVPGALKAPAIDRMLNGKIQTECPASILRTHARSALYLDIDSARVALNL